MEKNILEVSVKDIIPNRYQPRMNFDEESLNDLAESIKQFGIIQPLVVRKKEDKYEIIAGERRYKAALQAGLSTVPVILSALNEEQTAEVTLSENIQRKNLSVIEEAKSLKNLLDRGYLTQEQLASKMGLSQRAIVDKLQLLELDEEVQQALLNEKISERHARTLLKLEKEEQKKWLEKIINDRLTVRDLEVELKKIKNGELYEEEIIPLVEINPNIENIMNNAQDINTTREPHDVASFLIPDGGKQEEHKTTFVIPEPPEKISNKFFNFLEDEEANMNVPNEDEIISIFNQETTPLATPIEILEDSLETSEVINMNNQTVSNFDITEPDSVTNSVMLSHPEELNTNSLNLENDLDKIENTFNQSMNTNDFAVNNNPVSNDFLIQNNSVQTESNSSIDSAPLIDSNPIDSLNSINETVSKEPELNINSPVSESSMPSIEDFTMNTSNNITLDNTNSIEENSINEIELPIQNTSMEETNNDDSTDGNISPFKSIFFNKEEEESVPTEQSIEISNNSIEEVLPTPDETLVDPLDSIVTLEPDYAAKQEELAGTDLKTAINTIRNTISDLELRGFNIELEEADLEGQYHFTIKIIK